jgi:pentatricopeptide repeat protein
MLVEASEEFAKHRARKKAAQSSKKQAAKTQEPAASSEYESIEADIAALHPEMNSQGQNIKPSAALSAKKRTQRHSNSSKPPPKRQLPPSNRKIRRHPKAACQTRRPSTGERRLLTRWAAYALHRKLGGATTYHSIRSSVRPTAVFSSNWTEGIARLRHTWTDQDLLPNEKPFKMPPMAEGWAMAFIQRFGVENTRDGPGAPDAAPKTISMSTFARSQDEDVDPTVVWKYAALWLLHHQPSLVVDFLLATNIPLYPPINWVEDCFLVRVLQTRHTPGLSDDERRKGMLRLYDALLALVDRDTGEIWHADGAMLFWLLHYVSESQAMKLWDLIKEGKVKAQGYTLLHFAEDFVKRGQLEESLEAILRAKDDPQIDVNKPAFLMACSTLLRRSMQHAEGLRLCLRLIETLVGVGVKLNRHLCNILMLNAIEAGDQETASAVHNSALQQGITPDKVTHAILLTACKSDIGNGERLRQVIQDAVAGGYVRGEEAFATHVLHCLALHHTHVGKRRAFSAILEAYCPLFDPAPLIRLGIKVPEALTSAPQGHERLPPTPHAIGFIIAALLDLNEGKLQAHARNVAVPLYARWRELVERGDPDLLRTVTAPHISNTFLRFFCKRKDFLLDATRVVKDMHRNLPRGTGVRQCPPDVYTWSIFLNGFAKHRQTQLAEQVLQYMRSKGVEPNIVTYNSLLSAYAATWDEGKVLETLRRIEDMGASPDDFTSRALQKASDRQKVQALLDRRKMEKNMDFTSELKEGLEKKLTAANDEGGVEFAPLAPLSDAAPSQEYQVESERAEIPEWDGSAGNGWP